MPTLKFLVHSVINEWGSKAVNLDTSAKAASLGVSN